MKYVTQRNVQSFRLNPRVSMPHISRRRQPNTSILDHDFSVRLCLFAFAQSIIRKATAAAQWPQRRRRQRPKLTRSQRNSSCGEAVRGRGARAQRQHVGRIKRNVTHSVIVTRIHRSPIASIRGKIKKR